MFFSSSEESKSKFLKRNEKEKTDYKTCIQQTIKQLRSSFKLAMKEEECRIFQNEETMFLPGPTSQEVAGVQPIIVVLLEAIADCCQQDFVDNKNGTTKPLSSPPKTAGLRKEKLVAGHQMQSDRFSDCAVWKRGRQLIVKLYGFVEVTVEVKPGQRIDKNGIQLCDKARDHCLSNASKSLIRCLQSLRYYYFSKGFGSQQLNSFSISSQLRTFS